MKVWTTEDYKDMPAGSCLQEASEHKDCFKGIWCSAGGSWLREVPKEICTLKDPMGYLGDLMSALHGTAVTR